MKRFSRRTVAQVGDAIGVCFLVAAGWDFNTILGMALAGAGCLALSAVMDK